MKKVRIMISVLALICLVTVISIPQCANETAKNAMNNKIKLQESQGTNNATPANDR